MITNPVLETMLNHKSVRKFTPEKPSDEVIQAMVRAAQQAPFASQLYSLILSRKGKQPFGAALTFIVCIDFYKLERFMQVRGWERVTNDLDLLIFGFQDATLMAQNLVTAGESLGLGSCFIGSAQHQAERIRKKYKLPDGVFPLVYLVMGYPAEVYPPRPRYPYNFTVFEDEYGFSDETLKEAMRVMDDGYLAQGYYVKQRAKIRLETDRPETFTYENYSWTEHISRKWGQWYKEPSHLLEQLEKCGFKW